MTSFVIILAAIALVYFELRENESSTSDEQPGVAEAGTLEIEDRASRVRERSPRIDLLRKAFEKTNYRRHKPTLIPITDPGHLEKIRANLKPMKLIYRRETLSVSDIFSALDSLSTVVDFPSREGNPHGYSDSGGWIYIWGGEGDQPMHGYAIEKITGEAYTWHLYDDEARAGLLKGHSSYFFPLRTKSDE